jgi:prophage antirepressor-like protein
MSTLTVQIFKNPVFGDIRIAATDSGPFFCLADLCKAVSLSNPSSVRNRLDDDDVQLFDLHALNSTEGIGNSMANFVSESGFYDVLLQSSSPNIKPFRKWVTSEVLPSIRKHGAFMTPQKIEEVLANPDLIIGLATQLKEERRRVEDLIHDVAELGVKTLEQGKALEEAAPKILFADCVTGSEKSILVADLAKILKQNGIETGQQRLFQWFRDHGYLCTKGSYYNRPTQKAMEMGLFEVIERTIGAPDKEMTTFTTKVTGKGQVYFINKFLYQKK